MENSASSILALENSKLDEQVTLISDLNLIKDDWVIKVCVIRLWGLPDFKNPSKTYQLELVLVDEKGTKIQAAVQKQNLSRFQNLLKEGFSFYIKNFAIGASKNKIKYCNHAYKLNLYYKTSVTKCNTFRGSVYGFDLSSYPLIWARSSLPENVTIDVIGDVVTCGRIEENPDKKGVKLQLEIQDLNGKKLYVTLWDKYAEQMNDYIQNHELHGRVIIILQFANVKWFKERPSISSCYNVSKLFINSEIGEIIDFKNRLVAAQGDDSSHRLSIVSTKSYSISETFLVRNERKDIAELFEIVEIKSVIVVGTIKCILKDQPWYYLGCKKCTKKVTKNVLITSKEDESGEIEEKQTFECEACNIKNVDVEPRFRIPIRVQDSTGVISLTLFNRHAKKLLHMTAYDLLEKYQEDDDMDFFPEELNELLEMNFAFKVDITQWNIDRKNYDLGISELTSVPEIILKLDNQSNLNQPAESEPSTLGMSDTQAKQECLKDAVSYTGDVVTPSNFEKSTASSPSEKNKVNKSNDTPVELKRKLEDVYSQDDNGTPIASIMTIGCTTSPPGGKRTSEDVDNDCSVQSSTSKKNRTNAHNLKIPKIEKE